MVMSEEEITRRLDEKDTARRARRAATATKVGDLARRHAALAGQLTGLERELGEVLTAAGDVIDVDELAQVTDIPAVDLTRWRDQAAKPSRGGKRKRPSAKNNHASGTDTPASTTPPTARTVSQARPATPDSGTATTAAAVGAAGS